MEWYRKASNSTASYIGTLCNWAAFDALEAAVYKATKLSHDVGIRELSTNDNLKKTILAMLSSSQVPTPIGRVVFDSNGVNTAMQSIAVQLLPSSSLSEIVGPSSVLTATYVYPAPTWEERVYRWSLLKGYQEVYSVCIAAVCTFVLVVIIITVCIHRKGELLMKISYSYQVNSHSLLCYFTA